MTECIHHDEQWGFCYRIRDFRQFSPRKNFTCAAYLQDKSK